MRFGWLGVALAAILWGTAGFAGKILTSHYQMNPFAVGAWRLLLSLPLLIIAACWEAVPQKSGFNLPRRYLLLFILFGVTVAGYQISYFMAVDRTMVSTATLLAICSAPLFVSVIAHFFLNEKMNFRILLALGCGILGTILLIGPSSLKGLANPWFIWGNVFALLAACCYGGYTLVGKKLLAVISPFRMMAGAFFLGALFMLPFLEFPQKEGKAWLLLIYLGLVPTALAYILFSWGLAQTTATKASIVALLEPLTATFLATTLLGEWLSPVAWIGSLLLFSSLVLLSVPERMRKRAEGHRSPRKVKG